MFRKFAPVLACVTLLVSGCGGDDDGSSPSGSSSDANAAKPLTKAEYVAQGNKICRDTEKAQEPFDDRADELDRDDLEAAGQLFEEAFAVTRDGYEKLKALSPPAAEEARVTEYLTAVERLLDNREKVVQPLRDEDRAAAAKVASADDGFAAKQDRLGDALGLDDCSNLF
jgi:hypothetical protein